MTAQPRYLSGTNGFIPEATGQAIAFVRDPKEFKLNEYCQYIPTKTTVGVYAYLDQDQQVRIISDAEFAWNDGDDRPSGNYNQGNFQWKEFRTQRRNYGFRLGWEAINQADGWNPKLFQNAIVMSQAMTNRTNRVITLLQTAANWGSNTSDANVLNGGAGKWNTGSGDPTSPNYLAIKKSILAACQYINQATNAVVKMKDLRLVISPALAVAMAETSEMNEFFKNNQYALANVKGEPPVNEEWGLPDRYAGLPVTVEDAVITSINPNSAGTYATVPAQKTYVMSGSSAVIMSRKGGIQGNYGSPSYSTLQMYFYEYELAVEGFDDPQNKRINGNAVDHYKEILAAPPSGYLITNTL
jgi:hypothetical protein